MIIVYKNVKITSDEKVLTIQPEIINDIKKILLVIPSDIQVSVNSTHISLDGNSENVNSFGIKLKESFKKLAI